MPHRIGALACQSPPWNATVAQWFVPRVSYPNLPGSIPSPAKYLLVFFRWFSQDFPDRVAFP